MTQAKASTIHVMSLKIFFNFLFRVTASTIAVAVIAIGSQAVASILNPQSQQSLAQDIAVPSAPLGCTVVTGTVDDSDEIVSEEISTDLSGRHVEFYRYRVLPGSLIAFEISSQDSELEIALRLAYHRISKLEHEVRPSETARPDSFSSELSVTSETLEATFMGDADTDPSPARDVRRIGFIIPRSEYADLTIPGEDGEFGEYNLVITASGEGNYRLRSAVMQLESPPEPSGDIGFPEQLTDDQVVVAIENLCQTSL